MNKKDGFLVLLSATLLSVGIHPAVPHVFGWLGVLPLFLLYLDSRCSTKKLIAYTFVVGVIYAATLLSWLFYFDWKIYFVAVAIFAPAFAIYFFFLRVLSARASKTSVIILMSIALWVIAWKAYSLTPFGSIPLEVPFYGSAALMRVIRWSGAGILGGLGMGFTSALALVIEKRTIRRTIYLGGIVALLIAIYLLGSLSRVPLSGRTVKLALVQHNLSMSGLWRMDHQDEIKEKLRRLTLEAAADHPDLIVLPLYSLEDDALRRPDFFTSLAREVGAHMLIASHIPQAEGKSVMESGYFTAAILYSPDGKAVDYYQATEAPPLRDKLEHTANQYKVLDAPFGKLGILLCYEDTTPRLSREATRKGAELIIALSNPGHFTKTHMPYYHLVQDRLRAIESGRSVVRVSANGYSALIDPSGRVVRRSQLNKQTILHVTAGLGSGLTPYHTYPDWLSLMCFLCIVVCYIPKIVMRNT